MSADSSSHVSVAVRGILFKKIDGASKIITFKKKVYQKIFIYRGDMLFSRAKNSDISLKIRETSNGKSMKIGNREDRFSLVFH